MMRLDIYEDLPEGMRKYLAAHGWHFSKKLCDHAVLRMYKGDESKMQKEAFNKEKTDALLKQYGVRVENDKGYDTVYVVNMGQSDYLSKSVPNQQYLAAFVKDYLDDKDGYEGVALTRYFADCIGKGEPLDWDDYI